MKTLVAAVIPVLAFAPACLFAQNQGAAQNSPDLPPTNQDLAPIPEGFDAVREGIAHGKIEYVEYPSAAIGLKRRMAVYTPPGYSSDRSYPVTYLLHGIGDDETGWDLKGSAGAILDNLIAEGSIVPGVVVMPNGQASHRSLDVAQRAAVDAMNQGVATQIQAAAEARTAMIRAALAPTVDESELAARSEELGAAELAAALARADSFVALQRSSNRLNSEQVAGLRGTPSSGDDAWGANFEQDLIHDIIPYIESHYSVRTDRLNRALLGLSMGGGQTLNIGLTHQDLFAYVAAFSPAPNAQPITDLIADPAMTNSSLKVFWISCGDVDTLVGNVSRTALGDLDQLGVSYLWRRGSGGHQWRLWKNDLYTVSQMLFR